MCKSALLKFASVASLASTMRALLWGNSKQLNRSWPGEANVTNITSNVWFSDFYDFPKRSVHYTYMLAHFHHFSI